MKKLMSFLVIAAIMSPLFAHVLFANPTIAYPVFDLPEKTALPQNVRVLNFLPEDMPTCNLLGLDELKASGSGQFSERNFGTLVNDLPLQSEQLIICDLREECHGFANALPICWIDELDHYGSFNQTAEEIELDEHERLRLALEAGYLLTEHDEAQAEQAVLTVSEVETERAFVEGRGHIYVRLPVINHGRPNDQLVDQFVQFIHCLSPDQWVHFHCWSGRERTVLFLLLFDIIKNHHQVSLEDILARHQVISKIDLNNLYSKGSASGLNKQEGFDFICEFYAYCQQEPDFTIPWSEWNQQQLFMFETLSDISSGYLAMHSHGNKGGSEFTVGGGAKWGDPDKGVRTYGFAEGKAYDRKGNEVGGRVTQDSDGRGEAEVYGKHKNN